MGRAPDFIGLGAQRSGTSWLYACLYDHPGICIPVKEAHFFSRERNWSKGIGWYESIFRGCSQDAKAGEVSTSYLPDADASQRIRAHYPSVKLMACLRDPADRAFSNYMNDVKAGMIKGSVPFAAALRDHPEYIEQGRYFTHLRKYLDLFSPDQLLILLHEESLAEPLRFMQRIYGFIGVDPSFVPSMLQARVNVSRVPRSVGLDLLMEKGSVALRRLGLHAVWWILKRAGLGGALRSLNTAKDGGISGLSATDRRALCELFEEEIRGVEGLMGRSLAHWRS